MTDLFTRRRDIASCPNQEEPSGKMQQRETAGNFG